MACIHITNCRQSLIRSANTPARTRICLQPHESMMPVWLHVHILLAYAAPHSDSNTSNHNDIDPMPTFDILRAALAVVVNDFVALTGRMSARRSRGDCVIDCVNFGLRWIEAAADTPLAECIPSSEHRHSKGAAPWITNNVPLSIVPPLSYLGYSATEPLCAIQVTRWSCGGFTIAFRVHHAVMDAASAANFMSAWATTTRALLLSPKQLLSVPAYLTPIYLNDHHVLSADDCLTAEMPSPSDAPPPGYLEWNSNMLSDLIGKALELVLGPLTLFGLLLTVIEQCRLMWDEYFSVVAILLEYIGSYSARGIVVYFSADELARMKTAAMDEVRRRINSDDWSEENEKFVSTYDVLFAHILRVRAFAEDWSGAKTEKIVSAINIRTRLSPPLDAQTQGCHTWGPMTSVTRDDVRHRWSLGRLAVAVRHGHSISDTYLHRQFACLKQRTSLSSLLPDITANICSSWTKTGGIDFLAADFGCGPPTYYGPSGWLLHPANVVFISNAAHPDGGLDVYIGVSGGHCYRKFIDPTVLHPFRT